MSPPSSAARNRPSGLSARRIWMSAPGRSLTNCSASAETTRSSDASRNGSASSSAATTARRRARHAAMRRPRRSCRPSRAASAARTASPGVPRSTRQLEAAQHRAEPLGDIVGDAIEQKRRRLPSRGARGGARAAAGGRRSAGMRRSGRDCSAHGASLTSSASWGKQHVVSAHRHSSHDPDCGGAPDTRAR